MRNCRGRKLCVVLKSQWLVEKKCKLKAKFTLLFFFLFFFYNANYQEAFVMILLHVFFDLNLSLWKVLLIKLCYIPFSCGRDYLYPSNRSCDSLRFKASLIKLTASLNNWCLAVYCNCGANVSITGHIIGAKYYVHLYVESVVSVFWVFSASHCTPSPFEPLGVSCCTASESGDPRLCNQHVSTPCRRPAQLLLETKARIAVLRIELLRFTEEDVPVSSSPVCFCCCVCSAAACACAARLQRCSDRTRKAVVFLRCRWQTGMCKW